MSSIVRPNQRPEIICFGDSNTYGGQAWPNWISVRNAYNAGIRGTSTAPTGGTSSWDNLASDYSLIKALATDDWSLHEQQLLYNLSGQKELITFLRSIDKSKLKYITFGGFNNRSRTLYRNAATGIVNILAQYMPWVQPIAITPFFYGVSKIFEIVARFVNEWAKENGVPLADFYFGTIVNKDNRPQFGGDDAHVNNRYMRLAAEVMDMTIQTWENNTYVHPELPDPGGGGNGNGGGEEKPEEDNMITNKNIVPLHVVSNVGHLAAIVKNNEEALHVIEKDLLALPYLKEDGTLDTSFGIPLYAHEIKCIFAIASVNNEGDPECINQTSARIISTRSEEYDEASLIEYLQNDAGISNSLQHINATGATYWFFGEEDSFVSPSIGLTIFGSIAPSLMPYDSLILMNLYDPSTGLNVEVANFSDTVIPLIPALTESENTFVNDLSSNVSLPHHVKFNEAFTRNKRKKELKEIMSTAQRNWIGIQMKTHATLTEQQCIKMYSDALEEYNTLLGSKKEDDKQG